MGMITPIGLSSEEDTTESPWERKGFSGFRPGALGTTLSDASYKVNNKNILIKLERTSFLKQFLVPENQDTNSTEIRDINRQNRI